MNNFQEKDAKLKQNIELELRPYLDGIRRTAKKNLANFKKSYVKFKERWDHSWDKLEFLIMGEMRDVTGDTKVSEQVFDLFVYLGLVESLGNCIVDILVMLLVANGIDFHIESRHSTPRIKHLSLMDELEKEKIPLSMKLNFLKDNKVVHFASIVDNKLRNDIAHLNFEIKENGIILRGKPATDAIEPCFRNLFESIAIVTDLLFDLAVDLGWESRY
jgi:hypothetical protein